jgi:tetratricopeptide (TPR) repeat protein
MEQHTISIHLPDQLLKGTVTRMAIDLPCTVMEIAASNQSIYYFLFYKNKFIAGKELAQIPEGTYLEKAFQKGLVLRASHPLVSIYQNNRRSFTLPKLHDELFNELQNHFTLPEVAFLATRLDHILDRKQINHVAREIFYHFQRNGQTSQAYRILWVMQAFAPQEDWVKHMLNQSAFAAQRVVYKGIPESLTTKDPLFFEQFSFHHHKQKELTNRLHAFLEEQSRWTDSLALYIGEFRKEMDPERYPDLHQLLTEHLSQEEALKIFMELYRKFSTFGPLRQDILHHLIELKRFDEAFTLFASDENLVNREILEMILDHLDLINGDIDLSKVNHWLVPLYLSSPEKKERIVRKIVTFLLNTQEVGQVKQWLEPLDHCPPILPIHHEISRMNRLTDDPDRQLELGELFYRYHLLDKAIACFSWEMELNPTNPLPIQWLSRIYKERGLAQEAKGYQDAYIQLMKYDKSKK